MTSHARTRAETRFAAIERAQQKVLSEQQEKARKISENTARLRALRLAKENLQLLESPAKITAVKKKAVRRISY